MRFRIPQLAPFSIGLALLMPGQRIGFQPAAGSRVAKTMETTWAFDISRLAVEWNGEDLLDSMIEEFKTQAHLRAQSQVRVVDEYGEIRGGRPLTLKRTFEDLDVQMNMEAGFDSTHPQAFLKDTTLTFVWDPKSDVYDVTSNVESLDIEDVAYRGEDMDLRTLLPKGEVQPGDTWLVEGDEVLPVIWPGLDWDQARQSFAGVMERFLLPVDAEVLFEDALASASIRCLFKGERETVGARYQVIALDAKFERSTDISEFLRALLDRFYVEGGGLQVQAEVDLDATLSGELLWDPAAGHLARLNMQIDYTMSMDVDAIQETGEGDHAVVVLVEAYGQLAREVLASDRH